jgi:hypothetical protein
MASRSSSSTGRHAGSHAHGLIAADLLKKLRFNVQLASFGWVTVMARRPRRSRSRKVAGTSLAQISFAPTPCTPGLIRRSRPMATRPGSADPRMRRSTRCARLGSMSSTPATAKFARKSPPRSRSELSRQSPASRPDDICPGPPTGKPARRHQGAGLVYVERRESLARSWPRPKGARQ